MQKNSGDYIRSMQMKVNITRKRTVTTYKFCIIIEQWWLTNQLVTKLCYELESIAKKMKSKSDNQTMPS